MGKQSGSTRSSSSSSPRGLSMPTGRGREITASDLRNETPFTIKESEIDRMVENVRSFKESSIVTNDRIERAKSGVGYEISNIVKESNNVDILREMARRKGYRERSYGGAILSESKNSTGSDLIISATSSQTLSDSPKSVYPLTKEGKGFTVSSKVKVGKGRHSYEEVIGYFATAKDAFDFVEGHKKKK